MMVPTYVTVWMRIVLGVFSHALNAGLQNVAPSAGKFIVLFLNNESYCW